MNSIRIGSILKARSGRICVVMYLYGENVYLLDTLRVNDRSSISNNIYRSVYTMSNVLGLVSDYEIIRYGR